MSRNSALLPGRRRPTVRTVPAVALLFCMLAASATAQGRDPLFSEEYETRPGLSRHGFEAAHDSARPLRERAARMRWDRFIRSDGSQPEVARTLDVNLFHDIVVVAVLDRVDTLSDRLIWSGHLTEPRRGSAVFVLQNGSLAGHINSERGVFDIRATADGSCAIRQLQIDGNVPPNTSPVPVGIVSPSSILSATAADRRIQVAATGTDWLSTVNSRRAEAGLPSVTENVTYSAGDALHARYVVKNDVLVHAEDPSNPWYTSTGDAAGRASNVMGSSSVTMSDQSAVDTWMQGPFHAIGVLDPKLREVGFGSYREAGGALQMGAALDVIRGLSSSTSVQYPVFWPGPGASVAVPNPQYCPPGTACYDGGESPDPLASCGYAVPAGLPILLQIGPGNVTPRVTSSSLTTNGVGVEHCVFDETTYTNPDPSMQQLGRAVLQSRNAIVMIPRAPLPTNRTYVASIVTNGTARTWSFGFQGANQGGIPSAPTGLTASAQGTSVTLQWNAPSGALPTTYIIESGSTPDGTNLANFSTGGTATIFSASGVGAGTYYVRVRAANAIGTSPPSNEVILIVGGSGCTARPSAPTALRVAYNSGGIVTLAWTAAVGAATYIVEAGLSPGGTSVANNDLGSAATSLTATGVSPGGYYVRIRAKNVCGISDPSNEVLVLVQ